MLASTSSANRRASQPKHKAACDHCTVSKVKCPGGGPPCKRCADSSQPCHYSLARRFGKPPGSKNRRTLERLRQAKDGDLKSSTRTGGGCSIPQNNDSRDDGDGNGAIDGQSERWEGDDFLGQPQTSDRTSSWSTSPLTNYHTSSDILQFIPSPEQGFWNGYDNMPPDRGDRSVFHFAEPDSPKIGGLEQAESRRTWADHPDDCWNVRTRHRQNPTSTNRRTSHHHQALTSSSLQIPQTLVGCCASAYENTPMFCVSFRLSKIANARFKQMTSLPTRIWS